MVGLKILELSESVGEKVDRDDMNVGDIVELPPEKAVEEIEEGVARSASFGDFEKPS